MGCFYLHHADSFFKGEVLQQRRGSEIGMVPEILEEILSHLPISHLYCNCRLVCRQWNDIIQREKVITLKVHSVYTVCVL